MAKKGRAEIGDRGGAEQPHRVERFLAEDGERALDAGCAGRAQAVERRADATFLT